MEAKREQGQWYGNRQESQEGKRSAYEAFGNENGRSDYPPNRPPAQRGPSTTYLERTHPNPSRVVHLRGVDDSLTESMISDAASQFGKIKAIMLLLGKHQALVEFENLEDASRVVQNQMLRVGNIDCGANFSTSPEIRSSVTRSSADANKPHNVLMMTVKNPRYPIDVDVINTISTNAIQTIQGRVLKIVMVRKHGVQAMVEFDRAESAAKAKEFLNGADIYSGCCTLSIEYAKPTTLNVHRNDKETFDYTRAEGNRNGKTSEWWHKLLVVNLIEKHKSEIISQSYWRGYFS